MNKICGDIIRILFDKNYINQRVLRDATGYSLGTVNKSLNELQKTGYLDDKFNLTIKALKEIRDKKPRNAVILAAGYGIRIFPINLEYPKGLLEIDGEPLIERMIKQLHEVEINDIYVVVGYMKEKYEYLIDKYNVKLIVNSEYAVKNNIHSLNKVRQYLGNTYIMPCDVWCKNNLFNKSELYSWYMVSDAKDSKSDVIVNKNSQLILKKGNSLGNMMVGISYITYDDADKIKDKLEEYCNNSIYNNLFWEEILYKNGMTSIYAKIINNAEVAEINSYEQLRELDSSSKQLMTDAIKTIMKEFNVTLNEITDIRVLKKGMTNRSFIFECKGEEYIMRIPGEGTNNLINRREEADVYSVILDKNICDDIKYFNPENGYKITRYFKDSRTCNPNDKNDVAKCIELIRGLHERKIKVPHTFDLFGQIEFYEHLRGDRVSLYRDYNDTKNKIWELKEYIEANKEEMVLTHIDAVFDNFLFIRDGEKEYIRLIDWEYAGMQDPHIDIAMFAIYAFYDREKIDYIIDCYFNNNCEWAVRIKIYCYVAICGLLWSNWCEYKSTLGVEFGEYSIRQYRYAKEYYSIAKSEINKMKAGDQSAKSSKSDYISRRYGEENETINR